MFTTDRDGDFELYTVRPDGTGLRRLTDSPGNDAHSIWSDDGEWIGFSSGRKGFKDEMALYEGVPPALRRDFHHAAGWLRRARVGVFFDLCGSGNHDAPRDNGREGRSP